MATMTEPQVKTLVRYRVEDGLAIIELDDPPANTYTHEMMRQLDDAILAGALRRQRARDRAPGPWRQVLLRRRQHQLSEQHHATLQVLLLSPRQRDPEPSRAHPEAHDRGAQRPHRGRRTGDRHGLRHPHRAGERRKDRAAGGQPRRAAGDRRHPAARAPRGQVEGDRNDGDGRDLLRWTPVGKWASSTRCIRRRPSGTTSWCTPSSSARPTRLPRPWASSSARCNRAPRCPSRSALAIERELQQQLFQSEDAKEGIAAYTEKRMAEFKGR